MRVNLARCFAVLLGISLASPTLADFGQSGSGTYIAPGKWSRFNAEATSATPQAADSRSSSKSSTPARTVSGPVSVNEPCLPAPPCEGDGYSVSTPDCLAAPQSVTRSNSVPQPAPSAFSAAISAPWANDCDIHPQTITCGPSRLPLSPWFAGGNVLFWNMANTGYQRFVLQNGAPQNVLLSTRNVDPGYAAGFDIYGGRYFDNGRFGLGITYFNFDPASEQATAVDAVAPGNYAAMPQWQNLRVDRDGDPLTAADNVYDVYDNASAMRLTRNVGFQGIEADLFCFGLSGARRLTPLCGAGLGTGKLVQFLRGHGLGCGYGYTSSPGTLQSPCSGSLQLVTSQGFRWFQFKDSLEFASSDAADGYTGPTDLFYNSDVTNDLYGYQFGSRLLYCLGPRLNASLGGKAGIYGNDVYVQQRLGTLTTAAYVNGDPTQQIAVSDRDVVLAGLGELNLGLGYRINNAWTINGGYRMLYASGVATSVSSIPNDYQSVTNSASAYANSSVLLHGAYFGTAFNW